MRLLTLAVLASIPSCAAAQDKLQYAQDKQVELRDRCDAIKVALSAVQDGRDTVCPLVQSLQQPEASPAKDACAKGAMVDEIASQVELVCSVFGGSDVKEQATGD